jgi:pimeloyl-ACP methyl ester carboxylesterase
VGTQRVTLSAGTVEYEDSGGSGRTVVLCHGLLMDGAVWEAVLPHLRDDLRVIRPVMPIGAHRLPMKPDADLSLHGQARLLSELLDRLDLRDVVLVVSDTGYPLLLAADAHERVGALVVLACEAFDNIPPGLPGRTVALAVRIPGGARLAALSLRVPFVRSLPFTLGPMSSSRLDGRLVRGMTAPVVSSREVRRDLKKYATAGDFDALGEACARLGSFDRPAVVIWSRADKMMPFAHAERLVELLPQSRLVALDDGGTLLQIDHPQRVAEELSRIA